MVNIAKTRFGGGKYYCEFILDGAEGDIVLRTDYFSQLRYVWDYAYPVNVGEEKGEFAEYKGTYYLRLTTQAGKKYIVSGKNTGTNFSLYRLKAGVCTLIKNANENLEKENCIIEFETEESVAYVIRFDSKNANNPKVSLTEAKNIEKIELSDDNSGVYQYYYGNACKPDNLKLDIYYEENSIARKVNYLAGSWYFGDDTRYYPGFFIEVVKSDKVTSAAKDSRGYYPANNSGECYYWKITPNENHTDTEACIEYVPFTVISVSGKYTITYNSNAAALSEADSLATVSGKMSKQSVKANVATALWGNKFICKGYTFVGWTDCETIPYVFNDGLSLEEIENLYGEKIYNSGEKVINLGGNGSNITLYAVWKQEKYTITYHLGGASFVSDAMPVYSYTHTSGEIDLQPISNMLDAISVSPYTFNGWYLDANCKKKVTEIPAGSTGNIDLYALWSPPVYTIMFYGNGGTAKYEKYSQAITYGIAATLIANPYSNTGLGFAGWATESSEGLIVCSDKGRIEINNDNLADFDVDGDGLIELHAIWADSFQIYYDLDGDGTLGDNLDEILGTGLITLKEGTYPVSYQYGSVVKLDPKPVRKGFTFGGWYADKNYKKKVSSITAKDCGNKTFYAKWLANEYTIAFNANGGKGKVASVKTKYFDDLSKAENKITVSLPECNFTKLGYYFYAWYTTVNGEKQYYSPGAEVYNMASQKGKKVTFYPEWRPETYKVYFSAEGGILDDENVKTDITGISYMEFTYNKNVSTITLPTPTLEDFVFAGWFTDRTYKKQVKTVKGLSSSITLYAKWNRNYTIHFDANGGSGTMADIKANTAKAVSLTGKFKKNGYALSGWSLEPQNDNSTDIQFANKQSLINPEKSMLEKEGEDYSLTLYAVWRNTFGIQFDSLCDDAYFYDSVDGQKLSEYTYGKEVKVLPKPIRNGYTFTGWYLDRQLKKKVTKIAKTDCVDLTLYAGWKAKSYQITFAANAPEGVRISGKTAKQKLNFNIAKKLNKCKFSAKGYTFLGWATTPKGKVKYQNLEKVTCIGGKYKENVTLYAVWEKNTYLVQYETAYDGMNTITYEIGDVVAIKDIPEPARLGYTFIGWYTDSSLKKKFTGVKAGGTGNYTLHAKWKRN